MEEYCRICLKAISREETYHISTNITEKETISQLIKQCFCIEIIEQDPFSKYLCNKCHGLLDIVVHFRDMINKTDDELKQKLICNTQESNSVNDNGPVGDSDEGSNKIENLIRSTAGRKPSKAASKTGKIYEFKCDICSKVLYGRSNRLKLHVIMSHSDIKNFGCEVCDKKFKSKAQLANHTRVHTGEKPYKCEVCGESFTSGQNLFNHKKKHTGLDKTYKCASCSKGYGTPGELEIHLRIHHTGEKPFLCEICSKSYSSQRHLGVHIKAVHRKTEKCPKCGLMLSVARIKPHLQKHEEREAGIRKYICDNCGKCYFSMHALKKHLVIHSGPKPFICDICQKSFRDKPALKCHSKTHSDVRMFNCEFCPKTYKYKQHLKGHVEKCHN